MGDARRRRAAGECQFTLAAVRRRAKDLVEPGDEDVTCMGPVFVCCDCEAVHCASCTEYLAPDLDTLDGESDDWASEVEVKSNAFYCPTCLRTMYVRDELAQLLQQDLPQIGEECAEECLPQLGYHVTACPSSYRHPSRWL